MVRFWPTVRSVSPLLEISNSTLFDCITLFSRGGGAFDATQDLNSLLFMNNCVYSVPAW